jgi:hypothetical protein
VAKTFVTGLGSRHKDRIMGSGLGWVAASLGWRRRPKFIGHAIEIQTNGQTATYLLC